MCPIVENMHIGWHIKAIRSSASPETGAAIAETKNGLGEKYAKGKEVWCHAEEGCEPDIILIFFGLLRRFINCGGP